MRTLFVTPSEVASGEAVTALAIAAGVERHGGECRFLASEYAAGFLRDRVPGKLATLGPSLSENRRTWDSALRAFRPDVIVFADYPLLFFSSGSAPLLHDASSEALGDLDCRLVTLDHLGYAQRAQDVFFGPPHRCIRYETVPGIPDRMEVLLPSPMQAPEKIEGRKGEPFRWVGEEDVRCPADAAALAHVRHRFLGSEEGYLVIFPVSRWAVQFATRLKLPHYRYLPSLIRSYLRGATRPVVLLGIGWPADAAVAADAGEGDSKVRFVRSPPLSPGEFARLVTAADLFLTDNVISSSLGGAVYSGTPCIALGNSFRLPEALAVEDEEIRDLVATMERRSPGAVFPWSVFPIWSDRELDELRILSGNSVADGFLRLELFGGQETRVHVQALLEDADARSTLRTGQSAYAGRVASLPTGFEALRACRTSTAPCA